MDELERNTRERLAKRFGIENVQGKTMTELEAEITEKLKRSTISLGTYEKRRAEALVEAAKGGATMREVVLPPRAKKPKMPGSGRRRELGPLENFRRRVEDW